MKLKLEEHEFQQKAVNNGINSVLQGQNICISSPTGSGKSIMELQCLIKLLNMSINAYVLTNRQEIIWGIEDKARNLFKMKTALPYLWTPITLANRLNAIGKQKIQKPDIIIVDEAHHLHADTWQQFKSICPLIGMTASPLRSIQEEVLGWKSLFKNFYMAITIIECIHKGLLVPFYLPTRYHNKINVYSGKSIKQTAHKYIRDNINKIFMEIARLDDKEKRPTIFSVPSNQAGVYITQYFTQNGIPMAFIDGAATKADRIEALGLLEQGDQMACSVDILNEGIDVPSIARIVNLRPTQSAIPHVQLLGRGLRPIRGEKNPNLYPKIDCEFIDFTDNTQRFSHEFKTYLGLELKTANYKDQQVLIPDLQKKIRPVDNFKSLNFSISKIYKPIKINYSGNVYQFDIGVIEIENGVRRWFLKIKHGVYMKYFYLEKMYKKRTMTEYVFKEVKINKLQDYHLEMHKDFKISADLLDKKFISLVTKVINNYGYNNLTIGVILSVVFLESLMYLIQHMEVNDLNNLLYVSNEEMTILDKWKSWLDLIPKPAEVEHVKFT